MKTTTLALFVLSLTTGSVCHGFSVSKPSSAVRRPDASTAVEEALKITAAFGVESNEAKVAWEIVEEMDASDNRCVFRMCVCVCFMTGPEACYRRVLSIHPSRESCASCVLC